MITLAIPVKNSRLSVIANALDSSGSGGLLRIYSGARPAYGEDLSDQLLLVEIRLPMPCMAGLDGGRLAFAPMGEAFCRRSGMAAWARLTNGDGHWVADLDAGVVGSGAEVELSNVVLFSGGSVNVTMAEIVE